MTNTETNLNENVIAQISTCDEAKNKTEAKQNKINYVGFAALILGFICFIWVYINISLFSQPISPTQTFGSTTPIFSVKMLSNSMQYSLTINGIIFVLFNLILLGLILSYFIVKKDFYKNLVARLLNKKCLITFLTFVSIVIAMYIIMFIMAFVPPNLSILLEPETGKQLVGNFNALFNWDTRSITVKNVGFYIMIVLFTISLAFYIVSSILYFEFPWIDEKFHNIESKINIRKQSRIEKKQEKNNENKLSLRELIAKAREAKAKAKQEKAVENSLRQNLTDVTVDVQNSVSIKPEEVVVDQHGSANQETFDLIPKIVDDGENNKGVDKSEPRRLGKFFADLKEKKKSKGTNINKKATVAAPTQEINDLVKQLMPD